MNRSRLQPVAALAFGLLLQGWLTAAQGATVTVNTTTSLSFSGTGNIALQSSGDPNVNDGYADVVTNVSVVQTPGTVTTGQTVITVINDNSDPNYGFVSVDMSFSMVFDLTLSTSDAGGFAGGLSNPVTLAGDPSNPLTTHVRAEGSFLDLFATLTETTTLSEGEYKLGVDINGNGVNDSIFVNALDFNLLDEDNIAFELAGGSTVDSLLELILAGVISPDDLTFDAVLVTTGPVPINLTGGVADLVDPPFTITGNLTLVPIPAAAWLLGPGLLALVGLSRRRAAAR